MNGRAANSRASEKTQKRFEISRNDLDEARALIAIRDSTAERKLDWYLTQAGREEFAARVETASSSSRKLKVFGEVSKSRESIADWREGFRRPP
jgi:hypothetical protein